MTTRVLPVEEWHRLAGTDLNGVALDEEHTVVIVVEDSDKQIVGCWAMLRLIHVEGLWIHPAHRKTGPVFRRLLTEMRNVVTGFFGQRVALSAAMTPEVAKLLEDYGGQKLPGDHYVFPVAGV